MAMKAGIGLSGAKGVSKSGPHMNEKPSEVSYMPTARPRRSAGTRSTTQASDTIQRNAAATPIRKLIAHQIR